MLSGVSSRRSSAARRRGPLIINTVGTGNSTRLIERVTHQRESGIAVPEAKARYTLRIRLFFMAIAYIFAIRSMTLARFLGPFSCYGGSLSSSTSLENRPLPGTLSSFRQVPD